RPRPVPAPPARPRLALHALAATRRPRLVVRGRELERGAARGASHQAPVAAGQAGARRRRPSAATGEEGSAASPQLGRGGAPEVEAAVRPRGTEGGGDGGGPGPSRS